MVDLEIGSKVQVYRGKAKRTAGGLTRKDIVKRTYPNGTVRYRSKRQAQAKPNREWSEAVSKALAVMRKRDAYYRSHITLSKDPKKPKAYALYLETRKRYEEAVRKSGFK